MLGAPEKVAYNFKTLELLWLNQQIKTKPSFSPGYSCLCLLSGSVPEPLADPMELSISVPSA